MFQEFIASISSLLLALAINIVPATVDHSCFPPVSPKPNTEVSADLGRMTIVPQISEVNKDNRIGNKITITVYPDTDARSIVITPDMALSEESIIDWGPKNLPSGATFRFEKFDDSFRFETHDVWWGWFKKTKAILSAKEKYWVTLNVYGQTVPSMSDHNSGNYGWTNIDYEINTDKVNSKGRGVFYIGGPQYPALRVERIGSKMYTEIVDDAGTHNAHFYGQPVTVKTGEPFEVVAKAAGQGGTATIEALGAHLLSDAAVEIGAGKTHTWKLLPLSREVKLVVDMRNKCGGPGAQRIEIPITYDFMDLSSKEYVNLIVSGYSALHFGKQNSALDIKLYISTMNPIEQRNKFTGKSSLVITDTPLTIQAVYKDSPEKIVKNILITPKGESPQEGFAKVVTDRNGSAYIKITAPNLTRAEAERGVIMLKFAASNFPNIVVERPLPITGVTINVPVQPKVEQKPAVEKSIEPKPEVKHQSTPSQAVPKAIAVSLIVKSSRSLNNIIEGDKIIFSAFLKMSDGSERPPAGSVTWGVIGEIGSISSAGVFEAKLDDSIAEYGEGAGAVTAIYKDSNENTFLGQSEIFKVELYFPESTEDVDMQG